MSHDFFALRSVFMRRLYALATAKGDVFASFHQYDHVGKSLGLDPDTTMSVAVHLQQKQLIDGTHDLDVWLTSAGLDWLDGEAAEASRDSRSYSNITITGSTVNFGDGASINVTSVTARDVFRVIESEIAKKVTDPEERKSLLAQLAGVVGHPAVKAVLQIGLLELLRRLGSGGDVSL